MEAFVSSPFMPALLQRSLDTVPADPRDEDIQLECVSNYPSSGGVRLRPLTTEAHLERPVREEGRQASDLMPHQTVTMPPIFPAPLSLQGVSNAIGREAPVKRRPFLPQLSQAKTFAMSHEDEGPQQLDDHSIDEDTEAFKQAMWAGQANILVTVRVRPHCSHDRDEQEIARVIDNKMIVVLDKRQTAPAASPQHRGSLSGAEVIPFAMLAKKQRHGGHNPGVRKLRNVASAHPRSTGVAAPQTASNSSQSNRSREKRYAFDYVFTPHDSQQTVYHHTTKFLIHGVLNGFNATVFAYGCTGAGKTYTMLGTPDHPGIMALTLDDLFQNIERVHNDPQATVVYKVTVSFLEVYNENIRDLLVTPPLVGVASPSMATVSEYLDLREDPVKGPVVSGLSEVEASNAHEVMNLLRRGNKHRSQEATAANSVSSRSHAVLQVLVEQREKHSSSETFGVDASRGGTMTSTVKYGKLSLVDLAGSERAAVTQNRGQRLLEGANINRSLLALGNCINALGEKGGASGNIFVPYRDSKLTRLLKDSLGGNCRTVMIANISPAAASVEETLNTLKYANRAKNIKTTVTRNVLSVDHHITEYAGVVAELKDEIASLRRQLVLQQDTAIIASAPSTTKLSPLRSSGSPAKSAKMAVESNNDEVERNEQDDRWKLSKLKEARGYVQQGFVQRKQLRITLLKIDHCISEANRRLDEPSTLERSVSNIDEPHEGENVGGVRRRLSSQEPNQKHEADPDPKSIKPDTLHQGVLSQLTTEKARIEAQLVRNQHVMDEFRLAIEESQLLSSDGLLRDLLLMEFRMGDLQVDNAILRAKDDIKVCDFNSGCASVLSTSSQGDLRNVSSSSSSTTQLPFLDASAPLFTEMARLLSADSTASLLEQDRNNPAPHSTRSSTGFAFLDDLRDRFYDRNKQNNSHQKSQQSSPKRELTADTRSSASGGSLSPRRQWGIHLNNTSLPYIRLKKKSPPHLRTIAVASVNRPSATESPQVNPSDPANQQRVAVSAAVPTATSAAPYLRVLKHRRKLHHQGSSSAGSQKKFPVVVSSS